jgi:hypothetical protein
MPIFNCDCCKYTSAYKSNYTRHLNSKTHLENTKCNGNLIKTVTDFVTENVTDLKNVTDNKLKNKKYDCPYCEKIFSHRQNVYEHKKICKFKDNPKQNISIDQSSNITNNTTNNINNITNNNTTVNNNTNIVLNYYQTDLSKLTDQHFIKALNAVNFCINKMIELVHFNPEFPENMNLKYTNINKDRLQYKDNEKWKLLNKGLDDVYDSYESIMDEWNDFNKSIYPNSSQKYEKYLENKEHRLDDIKEHLKTTLYNNTIEYFK